ncbi:MAG: NUDIX domain-containing protein [Anaerolineae bacterium]|nr:NUDIX domain-containing protein [Anaerolineae bacterium]
MSDTRPHMLTADGRRRFACSPVAILVFIVNEREEVLLLSHPKRQGGWEVVNGALEAGETLLEGALRETREEAGAGIQVRPLGTVHVSSFHYDERVEYMLSLGYLMAYEGGEIEPGSDMAGSLYRWWSLAELEENDVHLIVPPGQPWLLERAVELYRLWKGRDVELQPELPHPR